MCHNCQSCSFSRFQHRHHVLNLETKSLKTVTFKILSFSSFTRQSAFVQMFEMFPEDELCKFLKHNLQYFIILCNLLLLFVDCKTLRHQEKFATVASLSNNMAITLSLLVTTATPTMRIIIHTMCYTRKICLL